MFVLVCSCDENAKMREQVSTLRRLSQPIGEMSSFNDDCQRQECVHGQATRRLFPGLLLRPAKEEIDIETDYLTLNRLMPLMFAIKCVDGMYGIVAKGNCHWQCWMCNCVNCPHTATLRGFVNHPGFDRTDLDFDHEPLETTVLLTSVSRH
uniref:Uncharacterized protein n=1 Tax=Plectus sambesii TaxID=2011161 RepID=A0A914WZ47_9BILA